MATEPGGTPRGRGPPPLPDGPRAGGDGKREEGGAGEGRRGGARALPRVLVPPHVLASRPGALARPGGARCLPGYSARPASPPVLRRGREIRVSPKMVALGSG
ncbi:hypothetical protein P7K49_012853, partial [Saguinus oedipus]